VIYCDLDSLTGMWTRSRRRQASSLTNMPEDILLLVGEACSNPLTPRTLVHLATTSRQTLAALQPKLNELRQFQGEVKALCSKECQSLDPSALLKCSDLCWYGCGLTTSDFNSIGRLLQMGALGSLRALQLDANQIGDVGMTTFAETLKSPMGSQGSLAFLSLGINQITNAGMEAFCTAISSGSLPSLRALGLGTNAIGDAGMTAFACAIRTGGALGKLEGLSLAGNRIGNSGMQSFASAVASGLLGSLQMLNLKDNHIGDAGMKAFSSAISSGGLHNLTRLLFYGNKIGDAGMQAFSTAISSGSLPSLQKLHVGDGALGVDHPQLTAACKSRGIFLAYNRVTSHVW
jgi:hypothetical protein